MKELLVISIVLFIMAVMLVWMYFRFRHGRGRVMSISEAKNLVGKLRLKCQNMPHFTHQSKSDVELLRVQIETVENIVFMYTCLLMGGLIIGVRFELNSVVSVLLFVGSCIFLITLRRDAARFHSALRLFDACGPQTIEELESSGTSRGQPESVADRADTPRRVSPQANK